MAATKYLSTEQYTAVKAFGIADTPSRTRLEPQSASGDPRPGIEARVHDPLWLIGRQWQLGEFEGEDAGTPLTVRVVTNTRTIDRWAPGDAGAAQPLDRERQDLLEPYVEREPVALGTPGPGLRPRAEAATALLAALDDADLAAHRAALCAACPLDLDPAHHPGGERAALDPAWLRLVRLLGGHEMADGELLAAALEAAAPGLPPWLMPADDAERDALLGVLLPWHDWYRAEVSPQPGGNDAWVGDRLEYRFRISASAPPPPPPGGPATEQTQVLHAPAHGGGDIDWHSFDASTAPLPLGAGAPPAPPAKREVHAMLASPLRYPGMPVDRLWEMEDSQVNLGLVDAEPWDLARLLVAEFALTYGNDWLVVPLDVPFGSLTTVESVMYTTTFGERFRVEPTAKVSPDGHWQMYTITASDGSAIDGLLVPPGAVAVQDGPAVEEVLFLRDEMANMCWAVERSVQGPSSHARDRGREHDDPPPPRPGPVEGAQLDYLLQTSVPARWIPYLPHSSGYRAIELVQGAMTDANGNTIAPLGRLLNSPGANAIKDAEVPREGVIVRRHPSMTRRADGSYLRWTTRRVSVGRGEGASQLTFDAAITRKPRPNTASA
jgi:hypothetical protein